MVRRLAVPCVAIAFAVPHYAAIADGPHNVETWHVGVAPHDRLVQGWMRLEKVGASLVAREYAGGGTDLNGVKEPLDLSLSSFNDNGQLRLVTTQKWEGKQASETSTPSVGEGATLHVVKIEKTPVLGSTYAVLWRADVVRGGDIVGSLLYVARLTPIEDGVTTLDAAEVNKALDVVNKSGTDAKRAATTAPG